MGVVGTAEYLFRATGVNQVMASARKFSGAVTKAMKTAGRATEKTDKITRKSIVGYAALGAAIGTVFTDFLRSSSVISTLMATTATLFGALADTILVELVPVFIPLIAGFVELIRFVQDLPGPVKIAIGVATLLGLALLTVGGPLTAIALAIGGIILLWQNWGAVVEFFQKNVLEPFGDFLSPFLEGIGRIWSGLGDIFTDPIGAIEDTFRDLVGFFAVLFGTRIPDAIRGGINSVIGFFESFVNALITAFNALAQAMVTTVNAILASYRILEFIPAFIVVPVPSDITHTPISPIPTLPRVAAGGIFRRPTVALIGEAGPEAIVPLTGPIAPRLLAPILQAAIAQAPPGLVAAQGGLVVGPGPFMGPRREGHDRAPIILNVTNIFEFGAGGIPGLPDLGDDEAFRLRFREAGEEVGQGILTTLRRRRE